MNHRTKAEALAYARGFKAVLRGEGPPRHPPRNPRIRRALEHARSEALAVAADLEPGEVILPGRGPNQLCLIVGELRPLP